MHQLTSLDLPFSIFGFWLTTLSLGEVAIFVGCLFLMISGLARITLRRQIELLKNYLQPEELPLAKLVLRAKKIKADENTEMSTTTPQEVSPTFDTDTTSWPEEPQIGVPQKFL